MPRGPGQGARAPLVELEGGRRRGGRGKGPPGSPGQLRRMTEGKQGQGRGQEKVPVVISTNDFAPGAAEARAAVQREREEEEGWGREEGGGGGRVLARMCPPCLGTPSNDHREREGCAPEKKKKSPEP